MMNVLPLTAAGVVYMALVWLAAPRNIRGAQFFNGHSQTGAAPGFLLLAASAAISWIFAKSIVNAASLTAAFGLWGGIGYAAYYLSFIVVAVAAYFIRVRGKHRSLPGFVANRYGTLCMKLFLLAVGVRLLNEVWSNTKVVGLFFGPEGHPGYWSAVAVFTLFTAFYTLKSGLRGSILTDGVQMLLAAFLLVVILGAIYPTLSAGFPAVSAAQTAGGITFALLALTQVASYGFHDPVLTDRAFISDPKTTVKAFVAAGLVGGAFIALFGLAGFYAVAVGHESGNIMASIGGAVALPLLIVFNVMMLTTAGSTLDSTFSSSAKLTALDFGLRRDEGDAKTLRRGRVAVVAVALIGNLPLLTFYIGETGPAVIAATTVSGTMIMGLAPVFLLAFYRRAGALSFHLSLWTGFVLGILLALHNARPFEVFPEWVSLGGGKYADDLGVNFFGLILCCALFFIGGIVSPNRNRKSESSRESEPTQESVPSPS